MLLGIVRFFDSNENHFTSRLHVDRVLLCVWLWKINDKQFYFCVKTEWASIEKNYVHGYLMNTT